MSKPIAVGIDLGTTNSAAAWVDASGRTAMVRNAEGDLLTPSIVLFDDAEVVVGKEARSATIVHPDRVAEWVKRDMGALVYSRAIRGEHMPPEVIQACILRKLRAGLVEALGPEVQVVITVPAYFDEPRRKATADAGELANLRVLDIVNEPTAAALSFGELHGYLAPSGGATETMNVLVYDLGGGTFDVTLLRLEPGNVRTLATDGDVRLGGHDWDMRLVDYVADSLRRDRGADPRGDPTAMNRLLNDVVEAKHTLSARGRATIRWEHAGAAGEVRLTREEFEEITADLLERTAHTTRALIGTAGLEWADVSRVLLVGGATRMPMVRRILEEMTGLAPDRTVNPDEAVARGAALYAGHLLAEKAEDAGGSTFQVTNVNSHSLGVEGIEQETLRKSNVVLIPRNTPLPATFAERFVTKRAGQRSIVIQVLEGESSLPDQCTAIGRTVIRNLPPDLPQGWPVEVTFEYATNGRLHVRGTVPGTHHEVELDVERGAGLSEKGMTRWKEPVASASGFDAFENIIGDVLGLDDAPNPANPQGASATTAPQPSSRPAQATGAGAQSTGADAQPGGASAQSPAAGTARRPPGGQPSRAGSPPVAADESEAEPSPGVPKWLVQVIGFVVSAIVGLGVGYLLVSWLFPESGLLNPW